MSRGEAHRGHDLCFLARDSKAPRRIASRRCCIAGCAVRQAEDLQTIKQFHLFFPCRVIGLVLEVGLQWRAEAANCVRRQLHLPPSCEVPCACCPSSPTGRYVVQDFVLCFCMFLRSRLLAQLMSTVTRLCWATGASSSVGACLSLSEVRPLRVCTGTATRGIVVKLVSVIFSTLLHNHQRPNQEFEAVLRLTLWIPSRLTSTCMIRLPIANPRKSCKSRAGSQLLAGSQSRCSTAVRRCTGSALCSKNRGQGLKLSGHVVSCTYRERDRTAALRTSIVWHFSMAVS